MKVLVTGAAGFIGFHTAQVLLARGDEVVGADNLNPYYDPGLKQSRLAILQRQPGFRFAPLEISDRDAVQALFRRERFDRVVHLAAQAGVRYSTENPHLYVQSNITGFLHIIEGCRDHAVEHLVYASTSSVYGANTHMPFVETQNVDHPLTLYAATKKANELMAHSYSSLYGLPTTGLRFFTVYGPWGRPDMAYYSFAQAIATGQPITVYDDGTVRRDFTYIDDIVEGVIGTLGQPPSGATPPVRVLNIGNNTSEPISLVISLLEAGIGKKAIIRYAPRPAADVADTCASVDAINALIGFEPKTPLAVGIPRFVSWFMDWHAVDSPPEVMA